MAIYHCSVKVISRSKGRSAVGASAYRSGTKIENERDGIIHDYTHKKGIVYSEIVLPQNAPIEYKDRKILWNAVEKIEKDSNSRLAREIEIALPRELTHKEHVEMVREYIKENFVKQGMCVDYSIHSGHTHKADKEHKKDSDISKENPHVHIMLTIRPLKENGQWESNKTEKLYLCKNKSGEERSFTPTEFKSASGEWEKQYKYKSPKGKVIYLTKSEAENNPKYKNYNRIPKQKDPKSVRYGKQHPKTEEWNSNKSVELWREEWAKTINKKFQDKNISERVDHRSFERQGITDMEPTKHLGVAATHMEKRGIETDRGNINRKIEISNRQVHEINSQIRHLKAEYIEVQTDIQIQNVYNNLQIMKAIIPKANEKQLESIQKTIPTFDTYMDSIKSFRITEVSGYEQGVVEIKRMLEDRKGSLLKGDLGKEKAGAAGIIDLKAVAKELEQTRHEYVEVVTKINMSEKIQNRPRVTNEYISLSNQIQDSLNNIQKFDSIISKAEAEKESLGIFQGKDKKKLQETIDRAKENKQQQISTLKKLGVDNISKAPDIINDLKVKHEIEKQTLTDFTNSKKVLLERADQLKKSYLEKKGSLGVDQKEIVIEYQKEIRVTDQSKEEFTNLERVQAELKADRELDPKEPKSQNKDKVRDIDDRR